MTDGNGSTSPTTDQDADTYDWDTVFALNFTHANAAITANWANVNAGAKNVAQTASDDPSFNIQAVLGPWQLIEGGDGHNVRMNCPVVSGTYNASGTATPLAGANMQVVIEIGMEWVPDPDQFNFVISGNSQVNTIKADLNQNRIDSQLKAAFQAQNKPLSSAATTTMITANQDWVITDGTNSFYVFLSTDKTNDEFLSVYQYKETWKNNLKALEKAVSADDPAVVIIQIVNNPVTDPIAGAVLPMLLSTWFNTNIGQFNHVFSVLDLSPLIAQQTAYTWMLPTSTSYAVVDQGTLDTSIFGVLTMVQNNAAGENHQVSPNAIPANCDAGFLISGPSFMRYMMMAGAQEIFSNAPATSFTILNDGLTIQNAARILFGKFHLDDDPTGSVADNGYSAQLDATTLSQNLINDLNQVQVSVDSTYHVEVTQAGSQWLLTTGSDESTEWIINKNGGNLDAFKATSLWIEAGNFQMSLNHTWVQIQFLEVTYPVNSDWDTHVSYVENFPLTLKQAAGKNIFWMGDGTGRNMTVSLTQTQSAITREKVETAVFGAISLLAIAGPIAEGLAAGAEVGEVSADAGEAVIDEEAFQAADEADPEAAEENEEAAGNAAAARSGGRLTNIKAAFKLPRWQFVAKLAALAGAVRGVDQIVDQILKNAANNFWDGVPGFDDFAQTAIQPYTFPGVTGFTLNSAGLAGSLQVGLKLPPAGTPAP